MKHKIFLSFFVAILTLSGYSQDYHVRIGTIGNSITHGIGLPNPTTDAYPAQLRVLLEEIYGDTCIVENFGLTTTTMLKNGDVSYWDTQHLQDYLAWAPEICFILLGTNDTKPQNWDAYGDEFIGDYLAMIDTILLRNPSTKFMLAYPPPAFEIVYNIRDSIIVNAIIPAMDSVLKLREAELVDFHSQLLGSEDLFPDKIHPNVEGAGVMAEMIRDRMVETDIIHKVDTGLTFITSFETAKSPLPIGDSTELSWTSINADSVWLNGQLVFSEGSLMVSPAITTIYTLIAKGIKSSDTISINQEMYTRELSRLRIFPATSIWNFTGDTIFFQVFYYDQKDKMITNTYYNVQWDIIRGSYSYLFGQSDTSVYMVVLAADTTNLQVSFEEFSDVATIVAKYATGLHKNEMINKVKVFPNPCNDLLNIHLETSDYPLSVVVYDMKGALHLSETLYSVKDGQQIYSLNTQNLPEGAYILKIEYSDGVFAEKLFVVKKNN